jgi:hypothetical protein
MVVPKEPVPTPLKYCSSKRLSFFFSKVIASPSPLPIADPNIPITDSLRLQLDTYQTPFNFEGPSWGLLLVEPLVYQTFRQHCFRLAP